MSLGLTELSILVLQYLYNEKNFLSASTNFNLEHMLGVKHLFGKQKKYHFNT